MRIIKYRKNNFIHILQANNLSPLKAISYKLQANNHSPLQAKSSKLKAVNGFTLVELVLYIALAAIILLATTELLTFVLTSRIKNQTIAEVEQQGAKAVDLMSFRIRGAKSIVSPLPQVSNSVLTLEVEGNSNPVTFSLSGTTLEMEEILGTLIPLTSDRVEVSNLSFRNLAQASTKGIIRIEFTLKYANSSGRNEYNFTQKFYGSAQVR